MSKPVHRVLCIVLLRSIVIRFFVLIKFSWVDFVLYELGNDVGIVFPYVILLTPS